LRGEPGPPSVYTGNEASLLMGPPGRPGPPGPQVINTRLRGEMAMFTRVTGNHTTVYRKYTVVHKIRTKLSLSGHTSRAMQNTTGRVVNKNYV